MTDTFKMIAVSVTRHEYVFDMFGGVFKEGAMLIYVVEKQPQDNAVFAYKNPGGHLFRFDTAF